MIVKKEKERERERDTEKEWRQRDQVKEKIYIREKGILKSHKGDIAWHH